MNRRIYAILLAALTTTSAMSQELPQATPNLKQLAREAYVEGLPEKADEHLQSLLDLYRREFAANRETSAYTWSRRLSEVTLEYLRGGRLDDATLLLGEAADLNLPFDENSDDGLGSAVAGWRRRVVALDPEERFELLYRWSMPTESRPTVRVLTSLVPHDAPPKAFARAIGERPRDNSFPVSEINRVDGLFCSAWLLVKSAEETVRLRRLIVETTALADEGVPEADYLLALAMIVDADRRDKQLEEVLRERLAVLRRKRSPALTGKGLVPRDVIWQFGYTEVDNDPLRIDFKPLPYWNGARWQGSAEYPDPILGWVMVEALGGHAGLRLSPVRRWIAPADGSLSVDGVFKHLYDRGDGVRARIVSSRSGMSGEWKSYNESVVTSVKPIEVKAWDTIDFVVDRIEANNFDHFQWPVQLTLTTRDGEVLKFESASVDLEPTTSNVLANAALAVACLDHDRLQPIGASIIEKLLENSSRGPSALLRPVLQRAQAIASRYPEFGEVQLPRSRPGGSGHTLPRDGFGDTRPLHWVAVNGEDSVLHARGASRASWLAYEEHILQLSGARSGALLFRYPLTGEFEFSCEAQQGGGYPTDGGLVYGGLQFLARSGQQDLTVQDADNAHFFRKPCPFIQGASNAVFNRLSIRSTAASATFAVNGHPVWEDSRLADLSPWIGLRAFGDRRPLFRNIKITGSPIIPREVRLLDDDVMRGWQAKFFGESQPSFEESRRTGLPTVENAGTRQLEDLSYSWNVHEGTIHNAKRDVAAGANPQSLLRYQRPLLDGESISYDFFWKPGEVEVHPSLGRLAFLIEPGGVRLHWMTDGENEWTGLAVDNAIVEPLHRRGPKPLPLRVKDWNRFNVLLAGNVVTLSLNDNVIYEHPLESESGQQFGLFHDRRRSAVRVRNVVMTGNWPERLPADVFSNLAAATPSSQSDADRAALNDVFGEKNLATNVFAVRKHAAKLSDEQRYSFLADWVLATRSRPSFRLDGAFTTTNPAPTNGTSPVDAGGQLVAPAYDLIDVAVRLDKLDELRERFESPLPHQARGREDKRTAEDQQRARLAMLFLVEAARSNQDAAAAACEQLLTLRESLTNFRADSLWPETLVAARGRQTPETREIVSELREHLLGPLLLGKSSGLDAWDAQMLSLLGPHSVRTSIENDGALSPLGNWIPASVETAKTRSHGQPPPRWQLRGDQVVKIAAHGTDLLYYRIPLSGDFDVECTTSKFATRHAGLMFGGVFQAYFYAEAFHEGTLRSKQQMPLAPPLSDEGKPVRIRLRVRECTCTAFVNGRQISSRELPEHHEPWLAIYSDAHHLSGASDLRITGSPVVPRHVELAADEQLLGWLPYFDDRVGTENEGAPWRYREDPAGGWIVGVREPAIAGSFKESLLQYHRPIVEDGGIEYEFFYLPGQTVVHPAFDRLAFLLDPDGVKIHWVTDGAYAISGSDPTNQLVESDQRRGGEVLPLRANDWNRMAIVLRGDTVALALNGQLIYERKLEVTNQRKFGLFHFADQTDVRVRRVVLRGNWPKSVPSAADQELADRAPASLDETRAKLPVEFSHRFVDGGIPSKYFKTNIAGSAQLALRADGLFTSIASRSKGVSLPIFPRFTVHGDFDIELGFDQLELLGDQYAAILLHTEHADDHRPFYRVLRMQELRTHERVKSQLSVLRPDGGRNFFSPHFDSCESASGRLRLARRGDMFYFLFAEGDSTMFRIIDTQKGSAAKTVLDGIQFMPFSDGRSEVKVLWKHISIRAEKVMHFPPNDGVPTRKLIVMNVDGSEVSEVTALPTGYTNLGSSEWSADSKRIAFDVTSGKFSGTHIFVVNTNGTGLRDCGLGAMPSFSPDGTRIVFSQPGRGVMTMNADGSNRKDVDESGWGAQWSPDGKWIAWGRGGNNIIVMNAKTKAQRPLLVGEQAALFNSTFWNLGWSHDSRSIAFKARNQKTGGEDIVVADIDSPRGFKILLASGLGVQSDFSFSPDNQRILFAMHNQEHKRPHLYVIDRHKDGPPQLLPGQPLDWIIYNGDWSPDGKRIAFTGEKIPQPVEWPVVEAANKE